MEKKNDSGRMGTYMLVDKNELSIDSTYQREIRISRVKRISKDFRWKPFGCISVSERKDGFYVVDGGTRWSAAMAREDISVIPCLVFEMNGLEDEAKAFIDTNDREAIKALELHRAGIVAKDIVNLETEKIITKYGYRFTKSPGDYETSAVATVIGLVRKSRMTADATIRILTQVAVGQSLNTDEMKGLFYLLETNHNINFFDVPLKNMIAAGLERIRTEIKLNKIKRGNKGSQVIIAEGMLEILNRNIGNKKIRIPSI